MERDRVDRERADRDRADSDKATRARVHVRAGRLADESDLAAIDAIAWSPQSGFPSVFSRRPTAFFGPARPPETYLVAEADRAVAGFLRLAPATTLPESAHVLEVSALAVHPGNRRTGVGSALLTATASRARARGACKITLRVLSTNKPAIGLYERNGFQREGVLRREFIIDGVFVDDVLMARHLEPRQAP
jgi:ribosomal protein S18 acetylase RimI-like enzyme